MFILLWFVLLQIANVFQKPYYVNDWKSVIYSDKAGYYMYLPFAFIYHWDSHTFPDSLQQKVGYYFSVDDDGIIKNKYPIGVSYFQAPGFFYHYFTIDKEHGITGTEMEFNRSIARSVLFWTILGLVLLAESIRKICHSFWQGWFISLMVFFCTNLFIYTLKLPGYSHNYSFFLFSLLLYLLPYNIQKISFWRWFFVGLVVGLIFTVRTVNVVFAILYIMGACTYRDKWLSALWQEKRGIIAGMLASLIPLVPQMLYWKYAFGHFLTNSYKEEGFTGFAAPQFQITLLSTNNGLFTYTPIWILFIVAPLFALNKKYRNISITLLAIFLLQIYLCSSWSSPLFGCSFGHRVFVDMLPFAALCIAIAFSKYFAEAYGNYRYVGFGLFLGIICLCLAYTQRLTVNFNGCWGKGPYDYEAFEETLVRKKPDRVQIW
jgi:hypothetical protein